VDLSRQTKVDKSNILYKCGWSPFEGTTFHSAITHTIVNGNIVYENGKVLPSPQGKRMQFNP